MIFKCIATVKRPPVNSPHDYELPSFSWRHNGVPIPSNVSEKWEINSNITHTELHIKNVSVLDAGDYECLSSDGAHEVDGEERYVTITVSKRARLDVISKFNVIVD